MHQFSKTCVNSKVYPSELLSVQDQTRIVSKHSTKIVKAWYPYSCNGRKHRCKHVSDSVPSSFDTREHFDYNIASLTGIVINCSVSSSCNDRSNH